MNNSLSRTDGPVDDMGRGNTKLSLS